MIVEIITKSVLTYFIKPVIDKVLTSLKYIITLWLKVRRIRKFDKWDNAINEVKKTYKK